jgi:hypothetical protein
VSAEGGNEQNCIVGEEGNKAECTECMLVSVDGGQVKGRMLVWLDGSEGQNVSVELKGGGGNVSVGGWK